MWHSLFWRVLFGFGRSGRGLLEQLGQLLEEVWAILEETAWILEFERN